MTWQDALAWLEEQTRNEQAIDRLKVLRQALAEAETRKAEDAMLWDRFKPDIERCGELEKQLAGILGMDSASRADVLQTACITLEYAMTGAK